MHVQQCLSCRARWFPSRLICPRCHHSGFGTANITEVVIEQSTVIAATGHTIATVSADPDVVFIARVPPHTTAGTTLALVNQPDQQGAYVPTHTNPD